MVNPLVQALADRVGVKIAPRTCGGYPINIPVFDGQSIATHWLHVELHPETDQIIGDTQIPLSDHDFLHEIGHFLAAHPEQRDLPEYGLGALAFNTYHFYDACPEVVDYKEGQIQERISQLLSIFWGKALGLSWTLSENPGFSSSWEDYAERKAKEWAKEAFPKFGDPTERFHNLIHRNSYLPERP
jgi:hypothetical protein